MLSGGDCLQSKETRLATLKLQLNSSAGRTIQSDGPLSTTVGGTTPDTHGRPHGLRPQGRPSPQDESLRGTALLGACRKTQGKIS